MDINLRPELGATQRLEQTLRLSPAMIQSMEILQLTSLDLQEKIEAELEENPVLEIEEEQSDDSAGDAKEQESSQDDPEFSNLEDFSESAQVTWDDDFAPGRSPKSYQGEEDKKLSAMQNVECRSVTLAEHLEGQLAFCTDNERLRKITVEVIGNLDENGYLIGSLEEVLHSLMDWEEPPRNDELTYALQLVKSLDPPGVGARDLRECLLLQLSREVVSDTLYTRVAEEIVRTHLEDLGRNKLPQIVKALKRASPEFKSVTIDVVKEAHQIILSLDPRPGRTFSGETPHFIRPDVVVEKINGRYEVRVENNYFPRLRMRSEYRKMLAAKKSDQQTREFLRTKFKDAEFLLKALSMRENTLQRIANELIVLQEGFLENGVEDLRPLRLQDVSERLGLHLSTVSRAISGKYIQTPRGIFEIKFFFPGGATQKNGTDLSRNSVIARIKELIDNEDKKHPLSDEYLTSELKKQGISISRRTVTKYREAENIPSSRERKVY